MGYSTSFTTLVILTLTARAFGQDGTFSVNCDGFKTPDWNDCDIFKQEVQGNPHVYPNFYPGCSVIEPPAGTASESLNCVLNFCPPNADMQVDGFAINLGYSFLSSTCRSGPGTGGTYTNQDGSTTDGLMVSVVSNDDFNPQTRLATNSSSDGAAKKRGHARDFVARQQEGDNSYNVLVTQHNVPRAGTEVLVAGPLPAGSSYTTTTEDSKTTGISSSVEAGANFFEIFSTSVSLTESEDYTVSSSVGVSVLVDCESGQEGIVYWTPLFTVYQGLYEPSGDEVDWYVPLDTSTSSYTVHCQG